MGARRAKRKPEPGYSENDPKGWCGDPKRGAALGRPAIHDGAPEGKVTVRLSPLDRQGYDRNGTYFGDGEPLYWYADEGGKVDAMLRSKGDARVVLDVRAELAKRGFGSVTVELGPPLTLPCWGAGEESCPDKADAEDGSDLCKGCQAKEEPPEILWDLRCPACDRPLVGRQPVEHLRVAPSVDRCPRRGCGVVVEVDPEVYELGQRCFRVKP